MSEYLSLLSCGGANLDIYDSIVECLEDLNRLPFLIESIYNDAILMKETETDRLHFALVRLQIYSDIHRYEELEEMQKIRYVAQVLEKVIFGSLMLESEAPGPSE